MKNQEKLNNLGWMPFFQQQIQLDELELLTPARIVELHKTRVEVDTGVSRLEVPLSYSLPSSTIGDWVLLDDSQAIVRILERNSCFKRKAAGSKLSEQLIAANIDTAFLLCSLNNDFNLNRIERYLSVINEAEADAVVVLSKADLCDQADEYTALVQKLDPLLNIVSVNCLETGSVAQLLPWCKAGNTIVLLGSSGSGKSTLTNTLLNEQIQEAGAIRASDDKGRHTTTRRSLVSLPNGAMIIDTPGMRELQLSDCEDGINETFSDIAALTNQCRFADCGHSNEPGCEIRKALESGNLDQRRFENYKKLSREQAFNSASLAERRSKQKALGKYYKQVQKSAENMKRGK